jgi:hypothetical protein
MLRTSKVITLRLETFTVYIVPIFMNKATIHICKYRVLFGTYSD